MGGLLTPLRCSIFTDDLNLRPPSMGDDLRAENEIVLISRSIFQPGRISLPEDAVQKA